MFLKRVIGYSNRVSIALSVLPPHPQTGQTSWTHALVCVHIHTAEFLWAFSPFLPAAQIRIIG